jgi:hypothetical protein
MGREAPESRAQGPPPTGDSEHVLRRHVRRRHPGPHPALPVPLRDLGALPHPLAPEPAEAGSRWEILDERSPSSRARSPLCQSPYRNDRGVYLARLARAYAMAGEHERSAEVAGSSLAIAAQTESMRALDELAAVNRALARWQAAPAVATFQEHFRIVHDQSTRHAQP